MEVLLWRDLVSGYFPPYWNSMKIYILKLWKVVHKKNATHIEFLAVLHKAVDNMPLYDQSTIGDDVMTAEEEEQEDQLDAEDHAGDNATLVVSDGYSTPTPSQWSLKWVLLVKVVLFVWLL